MICLIGDEIALTQRAVKYDWQIISARPVLANPVSYVIRA
jgi:hypothetical protein